MKIATWNVNSLRVRLPHIFTWLNDVKPDILALQETKLVDGDFPIGAIRDAGYTAVFSGQKAYNGVAIFSRTEMIDAIVDLPAQTDPQRRVLAVTIGQLRILNLYVPNGESVSSPKYTYKLAWLKNLDNFLQTELQHYPNMIVLGDFNIAPAEIDVHDPAAWQDCVLFSDPERQAFQSLLQVGFRDCFRELHPTEKNYTWWDYRMNGFKRNLGLRIDHILASTPLAMNCVNCYIDKTPRDWERPSDHAPMVAEFAFQVTG